MGGLLAPDPAPVAAAPPPPPLPPAAIPPSMATDAVRQAGANQTSRARAAAGQTLKTSPSGDLTPTTTAKSTLLGDA